jgi:hypothetical protein
MDEVFVSSCIPGYDVNRVGVVRSQKSGVILAQRVDQRGYMRTTITRNKKRICITVHRIVARTFLGEAMGLQVNHKDGNKKNNRLDNLEWVTLQQNIDHARFVLKHKSGVRGENHGTAKLSTKQVLQIRKLLAKNYSPLRIQKKYGIGKSAVSAIKHKRTWGHLA